MSSTLPSSPVEPDFSEQLDQARKRLLDTSPPPKWSSRRQKEYLRRRALQLVMIETVRKKPSPSHTNLVCNAAELFSKAPMPDSAGADTIWKTLRADTELYADALDWLSLEHRSQSFLLWIVLLVAFIMLPIEVLLKDQADAVSGSEALLGGLIGCFLDWNRATPRHVGGRPWHEFLLTVFQPIHSAIAGLPFVLALRSGVINLGIKPADLTIYYFLAAIFAGYTGSQVIDRLSRPFGSGNK